MASDSKQWISEIVKPAGIIFDGNNPWDIKIINPNFYDRVKAQGSLGLGEAYMDGWWECEAIDQFFYHLLSSNVEERIGLNMSLIMGFIVAKIFNFQSLSRAFQVGERHYDLGNDLFVAMLGKSMTYSCGYWKEARDLDSAEEAKLDLICRKIGLQSGERVLDIGSGWGSFARHAAKNYGAKVVGLTVSKEQAKFAEELCKGLPIEFRLEDYRNLDEKFDKIVSIGMIEHVGVKNYPTYMRVARRCLKDDGLFLLHTIGGLKSGNTTDPWINKYIFPNGMIPSLKQLTASMEGKFLIEDVHNFGIDYDKTMMAWHENFERAWPELKKNYSERFHRMWRYYLLSCAGAFRARKLQLWQIVLSPNGVKGGYGSVR